MQESNLMSYLLLEVDPTYKHQQTVGVFNSYDGVWDNKKQAEKNLSPERKDCGVFYEVLAFETNKLYS